MSLDQVLENNFLVPGLFQYRLLFLCGCVFMTDALEINLLTFLPTCAGDEWDLSLEQEATISGIVFTGILIGSLFWGFFTARYGRRLTFLITCGIISVFGLLSGFSPNYELLIVFRGVVGFGIGGGNIPFDLLAEFLSTLHRGQFLVFMVYFWCFGSLLVAGFAWLFLSTYGWRFLTILTAVPLTITYLISIVYLPESPRWLLVKGRKLEAEKVVREAALVNGIVMPAFALSSISRGSDPSETSSLSSSNKSYLDLFRDKNVRITTMLLLAVWFSFGFTYYGLILFISKIYQSPSSSSSSPCSFDYPAIFVSTASEIVGVSLSAILVDQLGRVRTQSWFYGIAGIALGIMGLPGMGPASLQVVSIIGRIAILTASVNKITFHYISKSYYCSFICLFICFYFNKECDLGNHSRIIQHRVAYHGLATHISNA